MASYVIAFCAFGLLFTAAELLRPARPLDYRAVIGHDLIALALYALLFLPASIYLSDSLVVSDALFPAAVLELPLPVRFVLYYVLGDLGLYVMHRLMHTRFLWPIHRWHHSPSYMYWLAGVRATLPNQFLFNVPFAFFAPLLYQAPGWLFVAIFAEGFFQNNWMHTNVAWRSRWLELVLVTPRYHHIHHSNDPRHYRANLASRLTIWDRIFGTHVDPEGVEKITFGIDGARSPIRLALGI